MGRQTQAESSKMLSKTAIYVTEKIRTATIDYLENNNNLEYVAET